MSVARNVFDDDGRADERVGLNVSDDDRWAVNDGSSLEALRRRWAAEARAEGRVDAARALERHDDPERAAEDELLAGIRRDVERVYAFAVLREEPEASTW